MILPGSVAYSVVLLALAFVCWGTWPNTFKAADKKWRFELYYFDFSIGALIAALIAALTLGTLGFDGFSFTDDLILAGKRPEVLAVAAGSVFNLGNMLIVGALSVAGIGLAFPVGYGVSLLVGAIWMWAAGAAGNNAMRLAGAGIVAAGAVLATLAWRTAALESLLDAVRAGKTKSTRRTVSMKPVLLALAGSVFAGSYMPLLDASRTSDIGLGPYSAGFLFALGMLLSTFVFNLFFMNLPVAGEPLEILDYLEGGIATHAGGVLGGIVWYAGAICVFIQDKVAANARAGAALEYALPAGSVVLAAAWGVFFWSEWSRGDSRARFYSMLMFILLIAGVGFLSFGQIAPPK